MYPGLRDRLNAGPLNPTDSPFDLSRDDAYLRWREWKLEAHTRQLGPEPIEISNPRRLAKTEKTEITSRCRLRNFCVYVLASPPRDDTRDTVIALGSEVGLNRIDPPAQSGSHPVATLSLDAGARFQEYIPYTNQPINWHTDGYYNRPDTQIGGVIMHCVQPATEGGANKLLDPELVYIRLRDLDRDLVRLLMTRDAMSIPAHIKNGETLRPLRCGPVFSVSDSNPKLHMRYTARTKSIRWSCDETKAAADTVREILAGAWADVTTIVLRAHQGIVCNNVLHTRERFNDSGAGYRTLLRARYYDRVVGT